jgi:23S rRNA (cytosine1962-C5)-methyltransferase
LSSIPVLSFRPTKERRMGQGYLWAFRNELDFREKDHAPGSLVALQSSKGRPLALGFLNSQANLCFRTIARPGEISDEAGLKALLADRITQAIALRETLLPEHEARRLVYSEGDLLSGLIVDDYDGVLVMQISSLGMDKRRDIIVEALKKASGCKAIFERSEGPSRQKEGLEPKVGLVWSAPKFNAKSLAKHKITDAGLKFEVDLAEGQKTGFFIDQRDTRHLLETLSSGKECLDMFCHTGALSLALAKGGAKSVLGMDESEDALALAAKNAKANKLAAKFEAGDAFKVLRSMADARKSFDLVVLDPPSMAKGKDGVGDALRGYKELNLRALKLLPKGGLLVSCSCTQAVTEEEFEGVIQSAAVDAQCRIQEIHRLGQPMDHPRHPAMPETRYLKVLVFRKF